MEAERGERHGQADEGDAGVCEVQSGAVSEGEPTATGADHRDDGGDGRGDAEPRPRLSPEALAERLKLAPVESEAVRCEASVLIAWACQCGQRVASDNAEMLARVAMMGQTALRRCSACGESIAVRVKPPEKQQGRIVMPGTPLNRHERRAMAMVKRP